MNKIEALKQAAEYITSNELELAKDIIQQEYPFTKIRKDNRIYTIKQMMEQFYRDGFIDRYTGEKLVNPGMLRILSEKLSDEFPYHPHWKTDECHMAYWDFQPTVDHIYPIALGGVDKPENWASTSMVHNAVKSTFTLEQLGWTLKPAGNIQEWDGLSTQFITIVETDPNLLKIKRIKEWYSATKQVLKYMDATDNE